METTELINVLALIIQIFKAVGTPGAVVLLFIFMGAPGLLFFVWYFDRKDMRRVLNQYGRDTQKISKMYKANAGLTSAYKELAGDLKEVIMMNTQAMTKIGEAVETNQFCPMVRLREVKKARGKVVGGG